MILANTEELHDQIEALLDRVKELEDALRSLQASVSTQPHPLLSQSDLGALHIPIPPPTLIPASTTQRENSDPQTPDELSIDSQGIRNVIDIMKSLTEIFVDQEL